METRDSESGAVRRGVGTLAIELAVALIVFGLGLTVLIGSWHLGSKWTSDGPGAGYFPFYISLIMCISGAGVFLNALRKRPGGIFVDGRQLKQVLIVLIPAAVHVLAGQLSRL